MPRISDDFLDCVIYLYPSKVAADKGEDIGGSGFLVVVYAPDVGIDMGFMYAVTNRHVVDNGSLALRLTTKTGGKDTIETDDRDWVRHPNGDDVAVCLVHHSKLANLKYTFVRPDDMVTRDVATNAKIGPGDDIFVVGRFINHEGKQRNSPTTRFGHVAQMPFEPINIDGFEQEAYLVESRSIGGYSGSPVFWQILPFMGGPYRPSTNVGVGPFLLGIETGYMPAWEPLCDGTGKPVNPADPYSRQTAVNSGMMIVVPAWKLWDFLMSGDVMETRKKFEQKAIEQQNRKPPGVILTAASRRRPKAVQADEAPAENPHHLEDFTRLLNAAVKGKPQDD